MQKIATQAEVNRTIKVVDQLNKKRIGIESQILKKSSVILQHNQMNPNYILMKDFGRDTVSVHFNDRGKYSFDPHISYVVKTDSLDKIRDAVYKVKGELSKSLLNELYVKDLRVNIHSTTYGPKDDSLIFLRIGINDSRLVHFDNDWEMRGGYALAKALEIMKPRLEEEFKSLGIKKLYFRHGKYQTSSF